MIEAYTEDLSNNDLKSMGVYMYKKMPLIVCFLTVFLLNTMMCFATDYILYVRAGGNFGSELHTYWHTVKNDPVISHDAIRNYPPHCSLTGFFPKDQSREAYILAVENAIQQLGSTPRTISINGLIQGNQKSRLDYIKLSSSYLLHLTKMLMYVLFSEIYYYLFS